MNMMIFCVITSYIGATFAMESIIFAAIIYRHGDRTPTDTYPTDPWRNESLWPVKFGELTNTGKRQHYELGKWLRRRYSALLSANFDPAEIYIKSTDVDRTLMSAQANLAGMFPPVGDAVWNRYLAWQPVPVHTVPEYDDEILAMKKECLAYNKEMKSYRKSDIYKKRLSRYNNLMNYLTQNTGKKIKNYEDILDIYSTLHIESLYNFTLPSWTSFVYPGVLKEPACYSFGISAATPLLARLRAGPLIKDIVTKMTKFLNNGTERVVIYSGHDFTVGTILTALGLFDGNCPEYTSTILMELVHVNSTGSNYIRISYRNSTAIIEPHVLNIPSCGPLCPLDKFQTIYANLISVDFSYDCGTQYSFVYGIVFCLAGALISVICVVYQYLTKLPKPLSDVCTLILPPTKAMLADQDNSSRGAGSSKETHGLINGINPNDGLKNVILPTAAAAGAESTTAFLPESAKSKSGIFKKRLY